MAGIAQIAKSLGHEVSGCDANVYPPMSDVLAATGISVKAGYSPDHLDDDCDCVVIGNALSRGNALVEHVLDHNVPYTSGPAWLAAQVLREKRVIAVAGTHGKTSTSSMLAWILECNGLEPGFLIGGKPGNFEDSARLGKGEYFVIEADEYDTAFFDKRSKFVHYCPDIVLLNNLEFDHADIFDDIEQIKKQFHHLVRIVPARGKVIFNHDDIHIRQVLGMGCWSSQLPFSLEPSNTGWYVSQTKGDASAFTVYNNNSEVGHANWNCIGQHNMANALAAIAAAAEAGVPPDRACETLSGFVLNARRLQQLFKNDRAIVYEDFAHHPTAIRHTLSALRSAHPSTRLIAVIEPRSNTMQMGCHGELLADAMADADAVVLYTPRDICWKPEQLPTPTPIQVCRTPDEVICEIGGLGDKRTVIVAMSNGSFDGVPARIVQHLGSLSN